MTKKRGSLAANMAVVRATAETEAMATTSIHMPASLLKALRFAAAERAEQEGGRPSVSALVVELLERHRSEIGGG
jgi:hypothetical protein